MTDAPMTVHQRIRLPYRYTAGPAQRAALAGLAAGVVRGSRCDACGRVLAPARPYCPGCCGPTSTVVDLPDTGVLEGWTTRVRDGVAVTFGMIRLDGSDSPMLHRVEAGAVDLRVGLRVRARWGDKRVGDITDIEFFEPDSSPETT